MPQIQDPELSERLRRKFSIVGSSSIDTIAPELVGVVVVDELLPNQDRFEAVLATQTVGDTGDIPESGLINLSASQHLVIDHIIVSHSGVGVMRLRFGQVGGTPGSGAVTQFTDFRNPLNAPAVGEPATNLNTAAGAGTRLITARLLGNTPQIWHPNIVLDFAGAALFKDRVHVDSELVAITMNVTYFFHFIDPDINRPIVPA